jgi:hypothetical protein
MSKMKIGAGVASKASTLALVDHSLGDLEHLQEIS